MFPLKELTFSFQHLLIILALMISKSSVDDLGESNFLFFLFFFHVIVLSSSSFLLSSLHFLSKSATWALCCLGFLLFCRFVYLYANILQSPSLQHCIHYLVGPVLFIFQQCFSSTELCPSEFQNQLTKFNGKFCWDYFSFFIVFKYTSHKIYPLNHFEVYGSVVLNMSPLLQSHNQHPYL